MNAQQLTNRMDARLASLWVPAVTRLHRRPASRTRLPPPALRPAASASDEPLPSTRRSKPRHRDASNDPPLTLKEEARQSNEGVYDKLIDAFLMRTPEEWRKLIAFSKQWPSLAEGVFRRMEERAAAMADGGGDQRAMRRSARRLKSVSDELAEYAALVDKFRAAPSRDWEALVAQHRNALGGEFFNYIELRVRAATAVAAAAGQDESKDAAALAALGSQVAALVEAHDRIAADETALVSASERFADLLASESMEAAESKLDQLASSGQLDPALLLTMAKAYAGVKETDATKEEVKDIMAHLYFKAKESFAQQSPPEARILKFLLAVDSPSEREILVDQAFQPGPAMSTGEVDYVHTTPAALLNTVENVLGLYDGAVSKGALGGMAGQAAALMNPEVIARLRDLQTLIRKKYT